LPPPFGIARARRTDSTPARNRQKDTLALPARGLSPFDPADRFRTESRPRLRRRILILEFPPRGRINFPNQFALGGSSDSRTFIVPAKAREISPPFLSAPFPSPPLCVLPNSAAIIPRGFPIDSPSIKKVPSRNWPSLVRGSDERNKYAYLFSCVRPSTVSLTCYRKT